MRLKDVSIQAQRINNQQGQITIQGQADVISQAEIDNLEGAIAADLDVNIRSQGLNNNKGQISSAQGNLTLNAGNGTLTNQAATIVSGKTLTLSANQLDNKAITVRLIARIMQTLALSKILTITVVSLQRSSN